MRSFRFKNPSGTVMEWISKHTRAYYASFYAATGIAMTMISIGILTNASAIALLQPHPWMALMFYIVGAVMMFTLAATVSLEKESPRWRSNLKRGSIGAILFFTLSRGVAAALGTPPFGPILALVLPLWASFVIAWAVPLIWYLPTELDEYAGLRNRLDNMMRRVRRLEKDGEDSDGSQ